MAAMNDVELFGQTADGVHAVMLRNKNEDKIIQVTVHIGGACPESTSIVTVKPLGEASVGQDDVTRCHYEIESARYVD